MNTLAQVAIVLAAAVIAVPLFRWLKLSSILGYVAAGLVIGPWGLRLVTDVDRILQFAEFGIVLLLFVIGLELQPTRLWVMRRVVFGLGGAQVASCALLLGVGAWLAGLAPQTALIVGFGLSLSSTPLILQLLAERGELKTKQGRAAFGILLFQDLAVLPLLAVLPMLAAHSAPATPAGPWWLGLIKLAGTFAVLIVGGRLLLRPALRIVARIRAPEVFTAAALLTVIATALLVHEAGLSMALGAFLAGVLLADSEFRHELEADIEPFKGLLLGLFFVAVGMSANLGLLLAQPVLIAAATVGFMLIKVLAIALVAHLARHARGAALRLAFTLATGGEFAFVLFSLALRQGILETATADLLILAVTLSMMVSPLLLTLYEGAARRLNPDRSRPFDAIDERDNRVIIAGFGRVGQIVARVLRARRIPFTALDVNQTQVDFVRRFGNKIYYGDASRLDLLRAAGADKAEVFVLAIDDVEAALRTAQLVRAQFPHLKIIARARNRQHAFALMDHRLNYIMRESYLSSLDMAAVTLETLGEDATVARATVKRFRQHDEATLTAQYAVKEDEAKLMASARESAQQLERLFDADAAQRSDANQAGAWRQRLRD